MDHTIRWAKKEDCKELGKIHTKSWQMAYKNIIPDEILKRLNPTKRAEYFQNSLEQGTEKTGVIKVDDKIIGFITIGECRDDDYKSETGEIWGMYLLPDYWRQGYGKALISWGIEKLKEKGYRKATLWVLEKSKGPRKFYERMGFIEEGKVNQIEIGKKLNKVRYIKKLI
ncbi:GNAT family N-acetyltransferase [Natranaerobius thermophilus]|uniref:GCN5-related N-acetyltransferase n=1 Tax=Natranaerobius thermophilus (strain ATCC BAA-1301 / DSM 18059 / JW/NM-WN-LF) TaxID=457570 RepID=B2A123_NATTJ|nr:GNAT family N-acetyltransferase [Natranaerobius thermophilus]ACB84646.1 GCN5-related N-acetyltransferase [Natranaerobius thermophilus JW/NM-WN-LF]